jgi:hypothetical protein
MDPVANLLQDETMALKVSAVARSAAMVTARVTGMSCDLDG